MLVKWAVKLCGIRADGGAEATRTGAEGEATGEVTCAAWELEVWVKRRICRGNIHTDLDGRERPVEVSCSGATNPSLRKQGRDATFSPSHNNITPNATDISQIQA